VFDAPSVAYIETLAPDEFAKFIYYLYKRDGLYRPVYVDGKGDGGVDIELRSLDGALPLLQGVVQCKRYPDHKVSGDEMTVFAVAARRAQVRRRFYFTLQGFAPAAFREARQAEIVTFDTLGIRNWILDIQRRERNVARLTPDLPHPDQFPVPILCVSNDKGGVGKTTITGNVAAALATDERGVLVIDADPAGYLSFWLTDEEQIEPDVSLHAVLTKQYPIHALIRKTLVPNLWLLPSSRALGVLPGGLETFPLERQLAYALAELPLFDPPIGYILIDTPPGPSFLTRVALVAAHYLVMPLQLCERVYFDLLGRLELRMLPRADVLADGEDGSEPRWREPARRVEAFLESPDRAQDLRSWLVAFVRDLLEIDAVAVYTRLTRGGALHALELVDGQLIKPLVDESGRAPQPQAPAYQQFLYGVPGGWYTLDELDYLRETARTESVYGLSRVERILLRVNQALRK
jgi:AAA domain/Restriction endonuclease